MAEFYSLHLLSCHCSPRLLILLALFIIHAADCGDIVKTLPGFTGELPFTLETGYISVEDSELFYLFVESTGNPRTDPLLLYLIGGPGCSALNGFFYQVGPLAFNETDYTGGFPQLVLRPYPWTKSASIIFIDAPVGTGYSYSTIPGSLGSSDTMSARQTYNFLREWLIEHSQYLLNRVYIASDSYSGLLAPVISQHILDGNAAGLNPYIHLKGMIGGCAHTSIGLEATSKIIMAHRLTLISDSLYQEAKESCEGWYYDVNPSNTRCVEALHKIDQLLHDISEGDVLEPKCAMLSPKPDNDTQTRRALRGKERGFHWQSQKPHHHWEWWCKNHVYIFSYIWANDKTVQEALHVREGTVEKWHRCNIVLKDIYHSDIPDGVDNQKNLTQTGLHVLLYNGDHDLVVPHVSTVTWIRTLSLTVDDPWRPWFVDGQVAGYQVLYSKNVEYRLTYATLKGSGHSPTEYKNRECFEMFERWIHFYPL